LIIYLIPLDTEKTTYAEVSTPRDLRQDMLNKIPKSFFNDFNTVFEPCSGKGGFLIDLVDRFMDGLKDKIKCVNERYKIIVEELIYFADINTYNIFICKLLLDPWGIYKLNYYHGDTLKLNINLYFDLKTGFDLIIGNPPYQSGQIASGNALWYKFVLLSLDHLNKNGYLSFVHPPGWRKPESDKSKYKNLFNLMTKEHHMIYLEIHNTKDGMKCFNCGTRYDWYLLQSIDKDKDIDKILYTNILDEDGNKHKLNLSRWEFLPNSNYDIIKKLLHNNKHTPCKIIFNSSIYGSLKNWIKNTESEIYKYKIVNSTPGKGVKLLYSSKNSGHFGIPKVIFGQTGVNNLIIDIDGDYGMTENAMAIEIDDLKEGEQIKKYFESDKFKIILKACSWSNYSIDWRLFTYFRKDFYLY